MSLGGLKWGVKLSSGVLLRSPRQAVTVTWLIGRNSAMGQHLDCILPGTPLVLTHLATWRSSPAPAELHRLPRGFCAFPVCKSVIAMCETLPQSGTSAWLRFINFVSICNWWEQGEENSCDHHWTGSPACSILAFHLLVPHPSLRGCFPSVWWVLADLVNLSLEAEGGGRMWTLHTL